MRRVVAAMATVVVRALAFRVVLDLVDEGADEEEASLPAVGRLGLRA